MALPTVPGKASMKRGCLPRCSRDVRMASRGSLLSLSGPSEADQALARANHDLEQKNIALQKALARAERTKRRAQRAKKLAEANAAEARKAKEKIRQQNEDLENKYRWEKARREELENKMGTSIIEDVVILDDKHVN